MACVKQPGSACCHALSHSAKRLTPALIVQMMLVVATATRLGGKSAINHSMMLTNTMATACGFARYNDTLGHLQPSTTTFVASADADACCAACMASPWCASWSFQHVWTPATPCHLSSSAFITKDANSTGNACGDVRYPSPPAPIPAKHRNNIETTSEQIHSLSILRRKSFAFTRYGDFLNVFEALLMRNRNMARDWSSASAMAAVMYRMCPAF